MPSSQPPNSPTSVLTEEHRKRFRRRAGTGRPLTPDDLAEVMARVELTPDVLQEVRSFLDDEGFAFDENPPENLDIETDASPRRRVDPHRLTATAMARASGSSDPVRMYLKEIGGVGLLSAAAEVEIADRIKIGREAAATEGSLMTSGEWQARPKDERMALRRLVRDGERARQELTSANLRLVVSIAKRYTNRGVPMLDLIQEGNVGLMRAVEKFDASKGFRFSTYATWWIRQSISRALADLSRTIRVPVHMVEAINRVVRVQRTLQQQLEREPTPAEIGAELDLSAAKVEELLGYARQDPLSLDTPIGDGEDTSMADFIADGAAAPLDVAARHMLADALREVLEELGEREAEVVRLRFGLDDGRPRTLEEVGRAFGVTRERVRQIESKTLAKLRHPMRSDRLRDYLE